MTNTNRLASLAASLELAAGLLGWSDFQVMGCTELSLTFTAATAVPGKPGVNDWTVSIVATSGTGLRADVIKQYMHEETRGKRAEYFGVDAGKALSWLGYMMTSNG